MTREEHHTDLNQREIIEALYNALEALLADCDNGGLDMDRVSVKAARAALRKAEGKS